MLLCAQWRIPHLVFCIFRVLLAGYCVYGNLHNLIENFDHGDTLKFFTIWSHTVLTAHTVLAALLAICFYK